MLGEDKHKKAMEAKRAKATEIWNRNLINPSLVIFCLPGYISPVLLSSDPGTGNTLSDVEPLDSII